MHHADMSSAFYICIYSNALQTKFYVTMNAYQAALASKNSLILVHVVCNIMATKEDDNSLVQ